MATMFDYTQAKFWGGSWYPYWTLILMTLMFGFFGLDHIWLRSPLSGVLKFILNIFTLGLWYFYDILQVLGEKESVMKHGLSAPFVGPLGIGAGMFVDNNPNGEKSNKEPYMFLFYFLLMWVPFGIDLFVAGDKDGAIIKFILTILFITIPIVYAWSLVNFVYLLKNPRDFFTTGNYHMFPLNSLIGEYGSSVLGPKDVIISSEITVDRIKDKVKAIPGVGTYVKVAGTTERAAAILDKVTASLEKMEPEKIISSIKLPEIKLPEIKIVSSPSPPDSSKVSKLIQQGGALYNSDMSNTALLVFFVIILGGGTIVAANRMGLNKLFLNNQKHDNDTPPEP